MSFGGAGPKTGLSMSTTWADLDAAWRERETEAAVLLATHPMMTLVLRMYALEIRLKAWICKGLGLAYLPNHCKAHDLDELILFTGLHSELDDPTNADLFQNWDLLAQFSRKRLNDLRYLPGSKLTPSDLHNLLAALDDIPHGVWTWLSAHP